MLPPVAVLAAVVVVSRAVAVAALPRPPPYVSLALLIEMSCDADVIDLQRTPVQARTTRVGPLATLHVSNLHFNVTEKDLKVR